MTIPRLPESVPDALTQMVRKLLHLPRQNRATISEVRNLLHHKRPSELGIADLMMETMEDYMRNLQGMVSERTNELQQATHRMEVSHTGSLH